MEKITKSELIEGLYSGTKFEKQDVQKIVTQFLDSIKSSLEQGKVVELRGFGTFEPRLRKGREEARNPKTGEKLSVQPHYIAAFRAGRELKNMMMSLETKPKNPGTEK